MNAVGVTAITFGIFIICIRGFTLVSPEATVRWFRERIRATAVSVLPIGAILVWAGTTGESTLANWLQIFGWLLFALGMFLVLSPSAYSSITDALLPGDASAGNKSTILNLLRARAILGIGIGLTLIYFGFLALPGSNP